MRLRRLNRPLVVVLTGVENSGKTTIGQQLSNRMKWPMIEEAARTDHSVLAGTTSVEDLQRLQDEFIADIKAMRKRKTSEVLLCDTGGLVLDMWAREVFGQGLARTKEAMQLMDLHLLFHTQPEWHPDPLRTLPQLEDRLALQSRYRERLISSGCTFEEILMTFSAERYAQARDFILQHYAA